MKYKKAGALSLASMLTMAAFGSVLAQDIQYSDFLSDYTQLQRSSDEYMHYIYLPPGAENRLANYAAMMIDQPEFVLAADSAYKGMKPGDLMDLADTFRAAVTEVLAETYLIVDRPGPNVLLLRPALTNLQLKKPRRKLLGYTPVGLVGGAVRSRRSDLMNKIDLRGLTIEMEVLDSNTEEQLAAIVEIRPGTEEAPASWEELDALLGVYSQRLGCRLDNARVAVEARVDCLSDL